MILGVEKNGVLRRVLRSPRGVWKFIFAPALSKRGIPAMGVYIKNEPSVFELPSTTLDIGPVSISPFFLN